MKKVLIFSVLCFILKSSYSQNNRISRMDYIEQYKQTAIDEMRKTGIPASITLSQACLESDDGNSWVAKEAHNHFGIKCGMNWTGEKVYKDDDSPNECFRKYASVKESFDDHSSYLLTTKRYSPLFQLDSRDYKAWAQGLKDVGYATNPQYAEMLIKIIEDFQLYKYDEAVKASAVSNSSPGKGKTATEDWNVSLTKHEVKQNNDINYILIKDGDSFETLAKEFDIWVWQILKYNELTKDSVLKLGQVLYIQPKRNKAEAGKDKHTVKQGETLYSISQYYGVKLKKLRFRNNIMSDKEVKTGDIIYLRKRRPLTPDTIK